MKKLLAAALSLGLISSAQAIPITETFTFSATYNNPSAPFPTINGNVTVSFDTTVSQNKTPVLSFTSNFPAAFTPVFFTYDGAGRITFGNNCSGGLGCAVIPGNDQFFIIADLGADGLPSDPNIFLPYTTAATSNIFISGPDSISGVINSTAIPEPMTMAMFGFGLLGLGLIRKMV